MNIINILKNIKNRNSIDRLIVGLGNVGPKYEHTRHNVGFKTLEKLAQEFKIKLTKRKFKSLFGIGKIENKNCLLLKPLTYMNCSGEAVEMARNYYKLKTTDLIVLVDDINFEPGIIRIRRRGSFGGHNGIKDIIHKTGQEDFIRIKIGVGKKPTKDYDLSKWVLSKFNNRENILLENSYKKTLNAISLILNNNLEKAMNEFN